MWSEIFMFILVPLLSAQKAVADMHETKKSPKVNDARRLAPTKNLAPFYRKRFKSHLLLVDNRRESMSR